MVGKLARILTLGVALTTASAGIANVSLKNGNFFVGYTDLIYPGGFEPKIERIYNSKTPYKGVFGWGWGMEIEAYLTVSADGSVVVHEYGGGAENRFSPTAFSRAELEKAVDSIVQTATKARLVGTQKAAIDTYRKKLLGDATFRNDEWEKLRVKGLIQSRQLKEGTQLQSNRFSYQYITKVKDGYIRAFDNGRVEKFSLEGADGRARLMEMRDKNGNFIKMTYDKGGNLEKIVDNFNRKILFSFNRQGFVEKIQGENGKTATYKYNKSDQLVQSRDVEGNVYGYAYDGRHNMTKIAYSDKTSMDMTYYGKDLFENVKSLKSREGLLTEYSYKYPDGGRNFRAVTVLVKDKGGKAISKSQYDYHLKYKANGEEWLYRMDTNFDGDKTVTVYNECCGLPLSIKRNGQETTFKYDSKGHVVEKVTPHEVVKLNYHPNFGKVTKVVRYERKGKNKNKPQWSQFKYDNKANLIYAQNSDKKIVRLFYDEVGRIKSMVDQSRRRIDFKYDANSKPIEIRDPQVGAIKVTYTNSGEIKKVESSGSGGRQIAVQVTSSFQNLLEIIRPAGVSLSF